MPQKVLPSKKHPFSLDLTVSTLTPTKLKVQAFDYRKPYSVYYGMVGVVEPKGRTFNLTFPLSPDQLLVRIFPDMFKTYSEYEKFGTPPQKSINILAAKVGALKTTPIWLSEDDREFIRFAEWFSTNASLLSATQADGIPSIYKSDKGKFVINYHNKIQNKDGSYVSTPARVGHDTGDIDVSQVDFMGYSIPGRMAILLHEYCHMFVNERTGLKVSDEIGADINALNIYLSLGFSPIEAGLVFLKVFETANNEYNHKRYLVLRDFMQKFVNGDLKQYYTLLKSKNDIPVG